jgi:molybdenum-dependent DNA-binding transcriptional regulator ModE
MTRDPRITAADIELAYRPRARATDAGPHQEWVTAFRAALRADDEHHAETIGRARHQAAKHQHATHQKRETRMLNRPKTLDLALIRAFVHTTDTGSITAAAPGLGYSQPGLSQRIQTLERILGHRLLVRTADGVHPTPAGTTALPHARNLLATAENLHRDLSSIDREPPTTPS